MCGIFGWYGSVPDVEKNALLNNIRRRGRNGIGVEYDGYRIVQRDTLSRGEKDLIKRAYKVIGHARATPATERETRLEWLQPYGGIVHAGTIANAEDLASQLGVENAHIDSMVLPYLLGVETLGSGVELRYLVSNLDDIKTRLGQIRGSFALAYFTGEGLILAANYKPLFFRRSERGLIFASDREMLAGDAVPLPPYTVKEFPYLEPLCERSLSLYAPQDRRALVACSGGLDSVTVAYMLRRDGYDVTLVHFDYGAAASSPEFSRVRDIAEHGDFPLVLIPIVPTGSLVPKRADNPHSVLDWIRTGLWPEDVNVFDGTLTSGAPHPDGHAGAEYAHDWIPARNLVMLSMLTAMAEGNGFSHIAFGGNLEESGAYPDNEAEFGRRFNDLLPYAVKGGRRVELLQPLGRMMKTEIIQAALDLAVPLHFTWSCYAGGDHPCGSCGSCHMRHLAFSRAGLPDPALAFIGAPEQIPYQKGASF